LRQRWIEAIVKRGISAKKSIAVISHPSKISSSNVSLKRRISFPAIDASETRRTLSEGKLELELLDEVEEEEEEMDFESTWRSIFVRCKKASRGRCWTTPDS